MNARSNIDIEYERLTTFDKFYVVSLFFYCFLLFAPTIYAVVPFSSAFSGVVRVAILGVLAVFMLQQGILRGGVRINKGLFAIAFAFVLFALIPSAYHQTTYLMFNEFASFYLVYALFLFYRKKHLSPVIDAATVFLFVMLIFSIIGFFYALSGCPPLLTGILPNGREYYWYLTTGAVDNGVFGNIIRPQGIYEEPGAFSFVICALCFLRTLAKKNDAVTFLLMLLGNITFSVIHAVIFALFILRLVTKYKMRKKFALYVAAIFAMIMAVYLPLKEPIDELLVMRFAVNRSAGIIEGNNRAYLLRNAIELVKNDNAVLIWGLPRDADGLTIMDKVWGYGENPLAPLVKFGIFIAWLYYFYLLFFLSCGFRDKKNSLVYFSIFLMLLQRPEFYRGGPAAIVLLLFFASREMTRRSERYLEASA